MSFSIEEFHIDIRYCGYDLRLSLSYIFGFPYRHSDGASFVLTNCIDNMFIWRAQAAAKNYDWRIIGN